MAHEMHGVLLVVLIFLLTEKHRKHLQERLGCIVLEKYIHLFELTITLECWLDQDEFSREELELATEFIPLFYRNLC